MLVRLAENRGAVSFDDLALVADRAKRVTGGFDLVEEAEDLGRVAVEVEFEDNTDLRESAQSSLHAVPDEALSAFGVDLDQIETGPIDADAVDGNGRDLDALGRAGCRPFRQRTRSEII